MPRRAQEAFWSKKFPDPQVVYDEGVTADVRHAVEKSIRERAIEIDTPEGTKAKVAARDVLTTLAGLKFCVDGTRPEGMPQAVVEFLNLARPVLRDAWERHHADALYDLARYADWEVVALTRIDSRVMSLSCDWFRLANHKTQIRLSVCCGAPERVRLSLDGSTRPVFRVWRNHLSGGLKWISCPAQALGLGGEEPWPVYVQTHALRQLHERLDVEGCEGGMEHYMARSLENPNVVKREANGDLLVEMRLNECRTGYLVVTPVEGKLVVRTFLLLTMRGTPEGDRFYERFRLGRGEAEWLRLHHLSSFTRTDLQKDGELRAMLEECGCGDLLKLRFDEDLSPLTDGYAAELRKFIGLQTGCDTTGAVDIVGQASDDEASLRAAA